jgi:hypothetical protein
MLSVWKLGLARVIRENVEMQCGDVHTRRQFDVSANGFPFPARKDLMSEVASLTSSTGTLEVLRTP